MNSEEFPNHTEAEAPEIPRKNLGHKILSLFGVKNSGEKTTSDCYLLSEHLSKKEKRVWKDLIDHWDNKVDITISNELGNLIEKYVTDPNYQFGVHRSHDINGAKPKTDGILHDIMQGGLVVLGDARSGSIRKNEDPSKTVSFCDNLLNAVILTKSGRQGSNGAVLVAIPSEYVNKEGEILPGKAEDVYNYDESGTPFIKPEYILGFAPGGGQPGAHVTFISRDEILDSTTENTDPQ